MCTAKYERLQIWANVIKKKKKGEGVKYIPLILPENTTILEMFSNSLLFLLGYLVSKPHIYFSTSLEWINTFKNIYKNKHMRARARTNRFEARMEFK